MSDQECPGNDERPVPADRSHGAGPWRRRAVLALAAGVVFALLLLGDAPLMRMRYLLVGEQPQGLFKQFVGSVREFGQAMAAIVAACIVASCDRRRVAILLTLALAELLSSAAENTGKLTIVRYRPCAAVDVLRTGDAADKPAILAKMRPGDSWVGWRPWNAHTATQSFPSGHSAAAFVLAVTLAAFYPRLAWLLWTLAACCALSRFFDAMHWPSDCWAGSLIGYAAAWAALKIHNVFQGKTAAANETGVH
jgi:membrane-associated phospholipid phosphatase